MLLKDTRCCILRSCCLRRRPYHAYVDYLCCTRTIVLGQVVGGMCHESEVPIEYPLRPDQSTSNA